MNRNSKDNTTPIPEELQKQLAGFQKSLWRIKITEAILAGLFGLITSFLIVFAIERIDEMPPTVRLVILLAGTSLAVLFAPYWVRRWVYGHKREVQLARLIAKKFPKLGDRLVGVVELQDQKQSEEVFSDELRQAAMVHVANQAAKRDMTEALPGSRNRKLALGLGVVGAAITAGFALAPKAGSNAFQRWINPFSNVNHYTFTQLDTEKIPNPMVVPLGEPFSITAPLSEQTDRRPETASAQYGDQTPITSGLAENTSYTFDFKGQEVQSDVTIKAGDTKHRVTIKPLTRPEVTGFDAVVTLPDYLQLPPRNIDIRTGALSAVEGSKIELTGTFDRDLSKISSTLIPVEKETPLDPNPPLAETTGESTSDKTDGEPKEGEEPEKEPLPQPSPLRMAINGNQATSSPFTLASHNAKIPFDWTDVNGLDSEATFNLSVTSLTDLKPNPYTRGVDRNLMILDGKAIEFEISAEDDFGLQEIGLEWRGELHSGSTGKPAAGSVPFELGSPSSSRLTKEISFSHKEYGISPQTIYLRSYAIDYKPERGPVYSEPIILTILTKEQHSEMIKNDFDRLISKLEDITRRELENLDANERLDQFKTPEALQTPESRKELAESEAREAENKERAKDLKEKMEELFQEAARNEDIPKESMKKMADTMKNLQELAEQDLPEVEQKLSDAQSSKSTPEKSKKDLKEAIEKQKDAIEKMRETIEKANKASEDFEAATFVNRLKEAARGEDRIVSTLREAMLGSLSPKADYITGAKEAAGNLDPTHKRTLSDLENQQKEITTEVRWIKEELGSFFSRTQKEEHGKVFEHMNETRIDEKLEELRQILSPDVAKSFQSQKFASEHAETLNEWAKLLEGSQDEDGGGGGGGGGGGSQEDEDFEFMLKVMKMVRAEQDIRSRTRSLEQLRRALELKKGKAENKNN